jgi:hypothetical protein
MRCHVIATAALALVCAMPAVAGPSAAHGHTVAATMRDTNEWSAAERRKRQYRMGAPSRARQPGRIACTRAGCVAVPAGCGVVSERDLDDNPTGFEIIVCPPR